MRVKKSLVTSGMLPFSPFPDDEEAHRFLQSSYQHAETGDYDNAVSRNCMDICFQNSKIIYEWVSYNVKPFHSFQIHRLNEAISLTLTGTKYYERYDQSRMLLLTAYSFLVWMALIAFTVVNLEMEGKIQLFYGVSHLVDIVISLLVIRGRYLHSHCRSSESLNSVYLCAYSKSGSSKRIGM